jgi:DNA-binding beta-propeller fold protein YncE
MDRRGFLAGAAALALSPTALADLRLERTVALVTADLESRLVVVDAATGRVLRHVPTHPKPRSIEAVGAFAVVAHSELGLVSLVDAASLRVIHVLRGFGEPRYTAGHPDGRYAYVSDAKRGEVVALDLQRGRVAGRVRVGALARHITISPDGRTLWVALGRKAKEIAVVEMRGPTRLRFAGTFRPPFLAHDVGWAPGGSRVWVTSGDRRELAIYAPKTRRVLSRHAADEPPQHVTFRGGRVYVASGDSGTVRTHSLDGRRRAIARVPTGSYNVQEAHGWVVTPGLGRGSLCLLSLSGRVVRTEQVARSSHDACLVLTPAV